ncbi:helix-turn-helix domain-containing protein [Actinoplanes sp. NBRC 101535]|uniref:helix-turn-helix domain-containing protein n=1 Tax=Actinoplanes sp. NBRC 101535 TaxID=3032196 RepID=UPI0024A361C6|nr:helix-turn-helix domain-containing protein [Actinoplanes sp. NBRC 101535]GLY08334.1 hypothetical protein Acsp01_87130 [Actinoplanes sp. NBRC 101535]
MTEKTQDGHAPRPTMSVKRAAELLGVHPETVRRWIDDADAAGASVAVRNRDEHGKPVKGRHRRPYADAVQEWARRRSGEAARPGPDED